MNNSKKIFGILAFLVLFIPSYLAIYNIYIISSDKLTAENTTKVVVTGPNNIGEPAIYEDPNDIKIYIQTVEEAKTITTPTSLLSEQPIVITFYKGEKQIKYDLFLNIDPRLCILRRNLKDSGANNNNANNNDEEYEWLHMQERDAERILNTTVSDSIYKYNSLPIANIAQSSNNSVMILPKEGDWNLRKQNGEFKPSSIKAELSETNKIKISQNKPFELGFEVAPDILSLKVYDNKELIFDDLLENWGDLTYDSMKQLQLEITAEWLERENLDYSGKAIYDIDATYEVPVIFAISASESEPGGLITVTAYNASADDKLKLECAELNYTTDFAQSGDYKIALLPIKYDYTGMININITGTDYPESYQAVINGKTEVTKNLGAQDDIVAQNFSETAKLEKAEKYSAIFNLDGNAARLWDTKFVNPRQGKTWLDFGWKITINSGNAYINQGVNLDADPNESIKACNAGRVIYAGTVPDDGKIIVIDHGAGLKSWYGHLEEFNVAVGDIIVAGQIIATVGKTGTYTDIRYNLYFALSVKDVFINPSINILKNGTLPEPDYKPPVVTNLNNNENTPSVNNDGGDVNENGANANNENDENMPVAAD